MVLALASLFLVLSLRVTKVSSSADGLESNETRFSAKQIFTENRNFSLSLLSGTGGDLDNMYGQMRADMIAEVVSKRGRAASVLFSLT